MIEKTFTTDKPLKIEGLEELAKNFPDSEWRELRVYFRNLKDGVEVRVGQKLNIVQLGSN